LKEQALLAIDYGEKKIGLALKEKNSLQPLPLGNFKNKGDSAGKVIALAKEKKVSGIVLGHPLLLSGDKSAITLKVEEFARILSACLPKKITLYFFDERFSTQETLARLKLLNKSEAFIQKNKDTYSAVLILERFLEKYERI